MRRNAAFLALFSGLALFFALLFPAERPASAATLSRGECVVEVSSRRILHEKDAEKPLPMASTTKLLTALIVIEDLDLDREVVIPRAAVGIEGSSVYLKEGDRYTVRDLLYGLMLRSGNDCAVALALAHSGSIKAFAEKMNERAALMGASNSRFANPHGLPDPAHHTTARDLALIAARAMENKTFREVVSCRVYEPRGYVNKNKMLTRYEGACGIKTGFTSAAGRCLVTAAERDGMALVSVVLNSPQMYERTEELLGAAFARYRMYPLCTAGELGGFYVRRGFSYPLTEAERPLVRYRRELFGPLPARAGEIAGVSEIYLRKNLLFSQNLYMMEGNEQDGEHHAHQQISCGAGDRVPEGSR